MIPQNLPAKWGYKATKNEKAEGLHWGEKPVNLSGPIRFYLGGRAKNRRSCAQFSVPHLPVDLTTSNLCKFQSPPHPKLGDSEPRPSPWTVQTPQNHLAKTHKPWQALTICSSGPSIPELVTPQKWTFNDLQQILHIASQPQWILMAKSPWRYTSRPCRHSSPHAWPLGALQT